MRDERGETDARRFTRRLIKDYPLGVMVRPWLDAEGRFLFGKYKDKYASTIARTDYAYIRWIVDNVEDISEDDRDILSALIERYS